MGIQGIRRETLNFFTLLILHPSNLPHKQTLITNLNRQTRVWQIRYLRKKIALDLRTMFGIRFTIE